MHTVVYIDVLFLLNFIINALLLSVCAQILRIQLRLRRLVLSAACGAAYAAAMFFPQMSLAFTVAGRILFTAVWICLTMRVRTIRMGFRAVLVFLGVSFAFGGTAFSLLFLTGIGSRVGAVASNGTLYLNIRLSTLLLAAAFAYGVMAVMRYVCVRNFSRHRLILTAGIRVQGQVSKFQALVDTGCELKDSLSGAPVMIVEADALAALPADIDRFFLPFQTVDGKRQEIEVFHPDAIWFEKTDCRANPHTLVGLTGNILSEDRLYRAVMNPDVIQSDMEKGGEDNHAEANNLPQTTAEKADRMSAQIMAGQNLLHRGKRYPAASA